MREEREMRGPDILEVRVDEEIRPRGHKLKGLGLGFGFDALTELGDKLHQDALTRDVGSVRKAVSEIGDYLLGVQVVYVGPDGGQT